MSQAMRWAYEACDGEVIDPHTAIGLHAARQADLPAGMPVVTLATAHPAKFPDAVERATGQRPALPARVGDLFERDERYVELPGDYAAIAAYVAEHATPSR
jgi:threonine synthase